MHGLSQWSRRGFAGALLAVFVAGCSQPAAEPESAPPPAALPTEAVAALVDVKRGDLLESIIVNAQLTPTQEAALFFRQGGRLKNVLVSSSDKVKAGQVLAELDVGNLGAEVQMAEIAMKKAQAKLEQARSKAVDRFEIQLLQTDFDSARISFERLRQQLDEAKLLSPYDGVVTETTGRPGESISAFTPVVTVADPTELQVTALVNSAAEGSRLAIGQPATLALDKFPNVKTPLEVVQLPTNAATLLNGSPIPNDVARSFKLNPTEPLPKDVEIGMLGRVTLVLRDKKGVLMVKSTAVRTAGPRTYVQVMQNGRKRDVDVEVGIVTPTNTEIVLGLNEGDRVVDGPVGAPTPGGTPGAKPGAKP
jgi:RND family efflux transporter MFP subunit